MKASAPLVTLPAGVTRCRGGTLQVAAEYLNLVQGQSIPYGTTAHSTTFGRRNLSEAEFAVTHHYGLGRHSIRVRANKWSLADGFIAVAAWIRQLYSLVMEHGAHALDPAYYSGPDLDLIQQAVRIRTTPATAPALVGPADVGKPDPGEPHRTTETPRATSRRGRRHGRKRPLRALHGQIRCSARPASAVASQSNPDMEKAPDSYPAGAFYTGVL